MLKNNMELRCAPNHPKIASITWTANSLKWLFTCVRIPYYRISNGIEWCTFLNLVNATNPISVLCLLKENWITLTHIWTSGDVSLSVKTSVNQLLCTLFRLYTMDFSFIVGKITSSIVPILYPIRYILMSYVCDTNLTFETSIVKMQ